MNQAVVGVGYRQPLASWINSRPAEIGCLEITAEHFFDGGEERLRWLADHYPLSVHGLGLSLGTPGPLDAETLRQFRRVVDLAQPTWISEHIAFTRSEEVDLGHLNPVAPTEEMLEVVADHARTVAEFCGRPLLLENITSYLRLEGEMSEPEFLVRLCEATDCGLLLDVTNLFINSKNHSFDPMAWLHALDPQRIVQLHVVGYTHRDGRWHDYHREPIQDDLRNLIQEVIQYAPVQAIIIERDDNFPPPWALARELENLKQALERRGPAHSTSSFAQ